MLELINQILKAGDEAKIIFVDGSSVVATFYKANAEGILVETEDGMMVVRLAAVNSVLALREFSGELPPSVEETEEEKAAEEEAVADEAIAEEEAEALGDEEPADDSDNPDSEVFSPIVGPKVVGRIDLNSIVDPRRKRPQVLTPTAANPMVPASGTVSSIGPAFGFVTSADGQNLYFGRGEVMQRNRNDELQIGSQVVFTPSRNARGGVAKCVHVQITMQEQLEWIERIEQFDSRNAKLLAQQLLVAFPDDSELADTLSQFNISHQAVTSTHARTAVRVADRVLSDVEHGLYVEPSDLLRAEKEIAATRPYEEAMTLITSLLNFAKTNSRPQCYQLYVRLTKLARQEGDQERNKQILKEAIEFYGNEAGSKAYFEGLLRKTSFDDSIEEPAQVVDSVIEKIKSSIKSNVIMASDNADELHDGVNAVYDALASIPEFVCFKMTAEDLPDSHDFERRFYYQLLCNLTKAMAVKLDTELALPTPETFLADGVTEFTAMGEVTRGIQSLRKMLTERDDTFRRKPHIVCFIPEISRVFSEISAGNIPEYFMRHYRAICETLGTSMQSVMGGTLETLQLMEHPDNRNALKNFTPVTLK